jgi:hypothetical protein
MRDLDIHNPPGHPHRHVASVITGPDVWRRKRNWTVTEVRAAIAQGDSFHTESKSTGRKAEIESYICPVCEQGWIRTSDDAAANGTLESLPNANSHPGTSPDHVGVEMRA